MEIGDRSTRMPFRVDQTGSTNHEKTEKSDKRHNQENKRANWGDTKPRGQH